MILIFDILNFSLTFLVFYQFAKPVESTTDYPANIGKFRRYISELTKNTSAADSFSLP